MIKGLSLYSKEEDIWLVFAFGKFVEARQTNVKAKTIIGGAEIKIDIAPYKPLIQRQAALFDLIPCPQGDECTTGCPQNYANNLKKKGFTFLELEEALRHLKRKKEFCNFKYIEKILKIVENLEFKKLKPGMKKLMDNFEQELSQIPIKYELPKFDKNEFEIVLEHFERKKISAEQIRLLQADGERISYYDFVAAEGFTPIVDMDFCFFLKDPNDMTLEEFRFFLIYSISDDRYAEAFRSYYRHLYKEELNNIYVYVHAGTLINNYSDLVPLLRKFKIRLSEDDYNNLSGNLG